jgi:hypothetical protein
MELPENVICVKCYTFDNPVKVDIKKVQKRQILGAALSPKEFQPTDAAKWCQIVPTHGRS